MHPRPSFLHPIHRVCAQFSLAHSQLSLWLQLGSLTPSDKFDELAKLYFIMYTHTICAQMSIIDTNAHRSNLYFWSRSDLRCVCHLGLPVVVCVAVARRLLGGFYATQPMLGLVDFCNYNSKHQKVHDRKVVRNDKLPHMESLPCLNYSYGPLEFKN